MLTQEQWKDYLKDKNYRKLLEKNFRNNPFDGITMEECFKKANETGASPLFFMFEWSETPQGHIYWKNIEEQQTIDLAHFLWEKYTSI